MLFDMRNEDFFSREEGFTKGNMFPKLYTPYKDYMPNDLNFADKEVNDQSFEFAINELRLYLCTHPDDMEAKEKLEKYEKEYKKGGKEINMINNMGFWRDYYV